MSEEYACEVFGCNCCASGQGHQYTGLVLKYNSIQEMCTAGSKPSEYLYSTVGMDQKEVADKLIAYCQRAGIKEYCGPIISGHGDITPHVSIRI